MWFHMKCLVDAMNKKYATLIFWFCLHKKNTVLHNLNSILFDWHWFSLEFTLNALQCALWISFLFYDPEKNHCLCFCFDPWDSCALRVLLYNTIQVHRWTWVNWPTESRILRFLKFDAFDAHNSYKEAWKCLRSFASCKWRVKKFLTLETYVLHVFHFFLSFIVLCPCKSTQSGTYFVNEPNGHTK